MFRNRNNSLVHVIFSQKRFAGGGGRPGGKPAFNWKEKLQLGITKQVKEKKLPLGLSGKFTELKERLDPTDSDVVLDLSPNPESIKQAQSYLHNLNNNTPKLIISGLFGSKKSYGFLPSVKRKQPFSYERIFGNRAKQIREQKKKNEPQRIVDIDAIN